MRVMAFLLLLAVLPTMELYEQVEHAVEHFVHGDAPDHSAHHDADPGDEHGCTGLVHLCACHQAQVTAALDTFVQTSIRLRDTIVANAPPGLTDMTAREPEQRPPIA